MQREGGQARWRGRDGAGEPAQRARGAWRWAGKGAQGPEADLLRCSISACFSCSSRSAEARLSSSRSAQLTARYAEARPGRAAPKEGTALLERHGSAVEHLTHARGARSPQTHVRTHRGPASWACGCLHAGRPWRPPTACPHSRPKHQVARRPCDGDERSLLLTTKMTAEGGGRRRLLPLGSDSPARVDDAGLAAGQPWRPA